MTYFGVAIDSLVQGINPEREFIAFFILERRQEDRPTACPPNIKIQDIKKEKV